MEGEKRHGRDTGPWAACIANIRQRADDVCVLRSRIQVDKQGPNVTVYDLNGEIVLQLEND